MVVVVVVEGATGTTPASHAAETEAEKGKRRGEGRRERRCRRETDDMARRISDTPPGGTPTERGEQGEKGTGEGEVGGGGWGRVRGKVEGCGSGPRACLDLASTLPLPCLDLASTLDLAGLDRPPRDTLLCGSGHAPCGAREGEGGGQRAEGGACGAAGT